MDALVGELLDNARVDFGNKPNAPQMHAAIDRQAELTKAFGHKLADHLLAIHAVLTPAQRQKLAQKSEQMHNTQFRGGRGGFGPGYGTGAGPDKRPVTTTPPMK